MLCILNLVSYLAGPEYNKNIFLVLTSSLIVEIKIGKNVDPIRSDTKSKYVYLPESDSEISSISSSNASTRQSSRPESVVTNQSYQSSQYSANQRGTARQGRGRGGGKYQRGITNRRGTQRPVQAAQSTQSLSSNQQLNNPVDNFKSDIYNVGADELLTVEEYMSEYEISEWQYPNLSYCRPYNDGAKLDLSKIVEEGRKKTKAKPEVDPNDRWEPEVPKQQRFIFANEIKRKGNEGVDNGDMIGVVGAEISYDMEGIATEYIVLERGNKRIQSFHAQLEPFKTGETLLQHFYLKTYLSFIINHQ